MVDNDGMWSLFANPILLMPETDYVVLVFGAKRLNSVTDPTNYSWPLDQVQKITTRVKGKFFSVGDLYCAYQQMPLCFETQKSTSFVIRGRQYIYTHGFHDLCGHFFSPNFSSQLMTILSDPLIKRKQAVVSINDTIMQSKKQEQDVHSHQKNHFFLRRAGFRAALGKTFFFSAEC